MSSPFLRPKDPSKRPIHEYLQQDYEQEQEQELQHSDHGRTLQPLHIDQFGDEFDLVSFGSKTEIESTRDWRSLQFIISLLIGIIVLVLVLLEIVASPGRSNLKDEHMKISSLVSEEIMALKESVSIEDAERGVVASDHPICSHMGLAILKVGGNAVDAAITTALCLGVANPASSGIGGGAFILISMNESAVVSRKKGTAPAYIDARDPDFEQPVPGKILEVIDCRETAPQAATVNMFDGLPIHASTVGGLAIAVPGELRGLALAHARWGKLPWEKVVRPVHKLATSGVPVLAYLASTIQEHTEERWEFTNLKKLLTKDNDEVTMLKEGDRLKNDALAGTMEAIMIHGADALYNGGRTPHIIEDIQSAGGIITANDLMLYKPTLRTPLVGRNISGYALVGVPPPSSGGAAVIGAARFLDGYKRTEKNPPSEHRLLEAMKHAFSIRMSLSDPAFHSATNVTDVIQDLVYNDYMETLRQETSDNKVLPLSQYGGAKWALLNDSQGQGESSDANEGDRKRRLQMRNAQNPNFAYLDDHGTTHLSVVDEEYNAVSITSSVNTYFGSGIVLKHSGILMNSQMDDFSTPGRPNFFGLEPSEANYIAPFKKPLSSMSPMFIFNEIGDSKVGELAMALGASGGPKIITAVLQTFLNYAVKKMPLFQAMAYPRLHDQLLYHAKAVSLFEQTTLGKMKTVTIEVSEETRGQLTKTGHSLLALEYTGAVQAIALDHVTYRMDAVSDLRKGGKPAGY